MKGSIVLIKKVRLSYTDSCESQWQVHMNVQNVFSGVRIHKNQGSNGLNEASI
jgi:hypothetical protein